jgi:hypothetical protein
MPHDVAPCGTTTAYRRHKRRKEDACIPCKEAWAGYKADERAEKARLKGVEADKKASHAIDAFESLLGADLSTEIDTKAELRANLLLIKQSMAVVAASDPAKLAPLSKRHSELLDELARLNEDGAKGDPLESFLSGDPSGPSANVTRFPSAQDREPA